MLPNNFPLATNISTSLCLIGNLYATYKWTYFHQTSKPIELSLIVINWVQVLMGIILVFFSGYIYDSLFLCSALNWIYMGITLLFPFTATVTIVHHYAAMASESYKGHPYVSLVLTWSAALLIMILGGSLGWMDTNYWHCSPIYTYTFDITQICILAINAIVQLFFLVLTLCKGSHKKDHVDADKKRMYKRNIILFIYLLALLVVFCAFHISIIVHGYMSKNASWILSIMYHLGYAFTPFILAIGYKSRVRNPN